MVWRLGGRRWHAAIIISGLLCAVIVLWVIGAGAFSSLELWPCFVLLIPLLIFSVCCVVRSLRRERLFIVDRAGIRIQHPRFTETLVPWARFGRARVHWISASLHIEDVEQRTLIVCRHDQLGSFMRLKSCADRLNSVAAVYQNEQHEGPGAAVNDGPWGGRDPLP